MRILAIVSLLPALAACPSTPKPSAPQTSPVARDAAALVIPVADPRAMDDALTRLADASASGDSDAAWARIHYLMDLFDDARFRRDDASLTLLHSALGHDENMDQRGSEATDRVLTALITEVDDLFAMDRMHPYVAHARTLLEFDARPPLSRAGLFTRMGEIAAISRGDGPLAENASLRLIGYCWRALDDVARTRYARRHEVLAHCLYTLYRADPAPYFARVAEDRPPPPRWRDIVNELIAMADAVESSNGRLARAGAAMAARVEMVAREEADEMPALPDIEAMRLPRATRVPLYDWTPLFTALDKDTLMGQLSDMDEITRLVVGDGRKTATIGLGRDAPASAILDVARALTRADVQTLELAVITEQYLEVPRGDYWYGRVEGDRATRMGVIPLSLAPFAGLPKVRSERWDPDRAKLGLYLVVEAETWTLTSRTGVVAAVPAASREHAQTALQGVFSWVYAAFPEEDAVLVVPGSTATMSQFVDALEATRHDAQGRELMALIGLAERAPTPAENTLADRIERRSKAAVEIQPTELSVRGSVVRTCYQEILDKRPKARGTFQLELHGDEIVIVSGPKDKDIRACLSSGLEPMMKEKNMASAQVKLVAE